MSNIKTQKNNFSISHWNCCSINNKMELLAKFLRDNNFDVFSLNETKLKEGKSLEFQNYNFVSKYRNKKRFGLPGSK